MVLKYKNINQIENQILILASLPLNYKLNCNKDNILEWPSDALQVHSDSTLIALQSPLRELNHSKVVIRWRSRRPNSARVSNFPATGGTREHENRS